MYYTLKKPSTPTLLLAAAFLLCTVLQVEGATQPGSASNGSVIGDSTLGENASPTLPQHSVAELQADFKQLYSELNIAHRDLYANLAQADYDRAFKRMYAQITSPMKTDEARVFFQRFMALGDIAHSKIDLPIEHFAEYRAAGGRMLPLFIKIIDGESYVDDYLGAESTVERGLKLISINDRALSQWINEMSALISADNQMLANSLIEAQFPFLLWVLVGDQEEFVIEFETTQPTEVEQIVVPTISREQQNQIAASQASEENADASRPREAKMLDENIAYLRPGPFFNITENAENVWDKAEFSHFINTAFEQFIEQKARALLIDLRNNPGGTNSFSDEMLAWFADGPFKFASDFSLKVSPQAQAANAERLEFALAGDISFDLAKIYAENEVGSIVSMDLELAQPRQDERFEGAVYLLIDQSSYSNAVSVAAIAQDYGFATVLGQPTADLATTYGAMEHFNLTHTGIEVAFPKALIVRPNGDTRPGGVVPDVLLAADKTTLKQDHLLEQALRVITAKQ